MTTWIFKASDGNKVAIVANTQEDAKCLLATQSMDDSWKLYNTVSVSNPIGWIYKD